MSCGHPKDLLVGGIRTVKRLLTEHCLVNQHLTYIDVTCSDVKLLYGGQWNFYTYSHRLSSIREDEVEDT